MDMRSRLEQANDNAAAFWVAQATVNGWESVQRAGFTAVRCEGGDSDAHRVVITRPDGQPGEQTGELLELFREWRTARLCLEDPFGRLDLTPHGCEAALGQAVMTRETGPVDPASDVTSGRASRATADAPRWWETPPLTGSVEGGGAVGGSPAVGGPGGGGTEPTSGQRAAGAGAGAEAGDGGEGGRLDVGEALDADGLAEVEETLIEGFPMPARWPVARGTMLPPGLLAVPGYRAWSARIDGKAVGACVSYEHGTTVGIYTVATLPAFRSRGVGRAVVTAALEAHPASVATLVATLLGEPLYRRLGFVEQGVSRWWRYPATPAALTV
ncbi:GNAT family N-acetyltransferase [Kitasatospora paranensis]|uniref:GNAT family N-acetyltransferase n=2 Tax=Kitasatospora paranensis TaxID=258053 RepID=A0ABW2G8W1_9ACTN